MQRSLLGESGESNSIGPTLNIIYGPMTKTAEKERGNGQPVLEITKKKARAHSIKLKRLLSLEKAAEPRRISAPISFVPEISWTDSLSNFSASFSRSPDISSRRRRRKKKNTLKKKNPGRIKANLTVRWKSQILKKTGWDNYWTVWNGSLKTGQDKRRTVNGSLKRKPGRDICLEPPAHSEGGRNLLGGYKMPEHWVGGREGEISGEEPSSKNQKCPGGQTGKKGQRECPLFIKISSS